MIDRPTLVFTQGDPAGIGPEILLREISRRAAKLPRKSNRTPDEIIGYDEHGLPT